jgi:hypothetical protein
MPYFVFRIAADKKLTPLHVFEKFKEAKDLCRQLRQAQAEDDKDLIRMTFAKDEQEARRLLADRRAPASPLEEWEA